MPVAFLRTDLLSSVIVKQEPFPYFIIPNFVKDEALDSIEADFPKVTQPGSFPLPTLTYGPNFTQLIEEIRGPEVTKLVAEKFSMDLSKRPTMITVRGQCRSTDGKVHTDSTTKIITVLLYMNGRWESKGGRLRLLRSPHLNDVLDEVPPERGALLVFKNQPNAWHGHESFSGERRAIQLNWVTHRGVVIREQLRHRLSALLKGKPSEVMSL